MLEVPRRSGWVEPVVARVLFVAGQAAVVVMAIFVYFRVRGLTEGSIGVASEHARDIVALERWLHIDVEAGLQDLIAPSDSLQTFANWIYIWGHWPVIVVTMLWLAWHRRVIFLRLRNAMLVSGALGVIVFVTYPVAPPRLAGLGLTDTVTEQSQAYRVLQPPAFVNQYAAMPSLHSGWDLLVGMAIFAAATSIYWKAVGVAMPLLMAFAVVATANHYVLDVVGGVLFALVGHVVALWLERRRAARAMA
jgi:membrane-associated phospholipid phosphatase